jgi:hypothetical protein
MSAIADSIRQITVVVGLAAVFSVPSPAAEPFKVIVKGEEVVVDTTPVPLASQVEIDAFVADAKSKVGTSFSRDATYRANYRNAPITFDFKKWWLETIWKSEDFYAARIADILKIKQELECGGVELVYAPVPQRWGTYPDAISGKAVADANNEIKRFDCQFHNVLKELRAQGVQVVDLVPAFIHERKNDNPSKGNFLFRMNDHHWNKRGGYIASAQIAAYLKTRPWFSEVTSTNRLITMIGDSHMKTQNYINGALQSALGDIPIDVLMDIGQGLSTSFQNLAGKRSQSSPDEIQKKRVFVWVHWGSAIGTDEKWCLNGTYWCGPDKIDFWPADFECGKVLVRNNVARSLFPMSCKNARAVYNIRGQLIAQSSGLNQRKNIDLHSISNATGMVLTGKK